MTNKILKRTIIILFLLFMGLLIASGIDIGDSSDTCEDGQFIRVDNGIWECSDTGALVGPQGPAGQNGTNGLNGSDGSGAGWFNTTDTTYTMLDVNITGNLTFEDSEGLIIFGSKNINMSWNSSCLRQQAPGVGLFLGGC